jgi:ubiquinone/menaquinone biosynthesis C-methylase UbiE
MTDIHPVAAEGFRAGAAAYVEGRPDYPVEIEDWLIHDLELGRGKTALDLAAGTGKFSPRLLATGATVIAVEPVQAMLDQLIRRLPEVDARNGSAQQIPLEDSSVDAVVCAQSFHWFATPEALKEIRRVLKPGGALGLVWNVRDDSVPWVAALGRIMNPFEGDAPRFHSQKWRDVFPAAGFTRLAESRFSHAHTGPPEKVIIDRILSVSFMAALSPEQRADVTSQLKNIIASYPELSQKAEVTFPYETLAFFCTTLT